MCIVLFLAELEEKNRENIIFALLNKYYLEQKTSTLYLSLYFDRRVFNSIPIYTISFSMSSQFLFLRSLEIIVKVKMTMI